MVAIIININFLALLIVYQISKDKLGASKLNCTLMVDLVIEVDYVKKAGRGRDPRYFIEPIVIYTYVDVTIIIVASKIYCLFL